MKDGGEHGTSCAPGACLAGAIGAEQVQEKDWCNAVLRFEGKIELWNELTKRHAIPHIGFISPFKFCPACGRGIDHEALSPTRMIRELPETLRSVSDSPAVLDHLRPEKRLALSRTLNKASRWATVETCDG
jgi:hypothetical protein